MITEYENYYHSAHFELLKYQPNWNSLRRVKVKIQMCELHALCTHKSMEISIGELSIFHLCCVRTWLGTLDFVCASNNSDKRC